MGTGMQVEASAERRGTMVEFPVNGRSARGYLSLPPGEAGDAAGTRPGVLVLQEWWGLVDHVMDVADRVAAAGFVALAPDLYHGERTTSPDQAGKLLMALDIAATAKDLKGAAEYLRAHPAVQGERVGVMGFCMGGQLALYAACEFPTLFAACVDFYGIHPRVEPKLEQVQAAVLGHFGRRDDSVPLDRVEAMFATMRAAGATAEHHVYEAGHAFLNDQRPTAYDAAAAAQAWDRTLDWLRKHLG